MTREELKKNIRSLFYSSKTVEKYLEKAYTLIDKIYNDHEAQIKAKNERIRELEEAMKPKTCDGCKYLDGVICKHDRGLYCVRQFEADYFVKDNA